MPPACHFTLFGEPLALFDPDFTNRPMESRFLSMVSPPLPPFGHPLGLFWAPTFLSSVAGYNVAVEADRCLLRAFTRLPVYIVTALLDLFEVHGIALPFGL